MKALIKVGYGCNNHCTFCHTLDVRDIDGTDQEVMAKIRRAQRLGHSMIVLSGGEVTMRRELTKWAAFSASLGMDFGLVTNGRMLAYQDLVDRLIKYRLKYVYMSLHGGDAKIHNLMVRTDAFDETTKAIANLSGLGLDFTVNAVITRHNVEHLLPIVDAVLPYPDVVLKFSMVQPKGGGEKLFEHLMPPVSLVAQRVHEAITYGQSRVGAAGPRFAHDGIPFCLLPGFESLYDDLKTHRFATMIEIGEGDFFPVDDKAKVQPDESCRACALRGPCPGLYRGYQEVFGFGELKTVADRARSNSFTYTPEAADLTITGGHCPVLTDGVTPWDRGRHVFVRRAEQIVRYRTDSRDFTDVEIEQIKHDHGQLYLDVSDKPAPDDFSRDLRQLRRSALCSPCPERDRCAGLWEIARDDVFDRDDASVRDIVAGLRGDVLDLGCGEGPYDDILAPLARSGDIRYVGVEPDAVRVEALRLRWPWADVRVSTAEAFAEEIPPQSVDHVLLLRSWNHLRDPATSLAGIHRVLRPGGTLLVVDNIAFGLLRSARHHDRARAGPAVFEHYRNDSAADAARLLESPALVPIERRDVTPSTSNQWILRYRRAAE